MTPSARTTLGTVLLVAALLVVGTLHAQTLPLPTIPEPLAPPPAAGDPAWQPTRLWDYSLGLAPGYDTNVAFIEEGTSDFVVIPTGELTRMFADARGQLRVRANGRGFLYQEQTVWNRVDAELSVTANRELSPRTGLRFDVSTQLGHTDGSRILDEQGVLLPLSQTLTVGGTTDLDWKAGARSTVRLGGRFYYTDFTEPELLDSSSARGILSFGRHLSDRSTFYVRYDVEYSRLSTSFLSHYGSLQWDRVLTSRSGLLLEVGVSYSGGEFTTGIVNPWNGYGGVSFARRMGRSDTVLYARREVVPAFGVGGLWLADRFGLRVSVPLGRLWLDLDGNHVRRTLSGIPLDTASSQNAPTSIEEASVALRKRVGRWYVLGLQARYRRQGPFGVNPAVDGMLGAMTVSISPPGAGGI